MRHLEPKVRRTWERILERAAAGEPITPIAVRYAREVLGQEDAASPEQQPQEEGAKE